MHRGMPQNKSKLYFTISLAIRVTYPSLFYSYELQCSMTIWLHSA
uniref:Uncharacterized protein n=1 Tax=Arundo donax TaxID=35708 RepID=A0A0A9BMA5_ARUDO